MCKDSIKILRKFNYFCEIYMAYLPSVNKFNLSKEEPQSSVVAAAASPSFG